MNMCKEKSCIKYRTVMIHKFIKSCTKYYTPSQSCTIDKQFLGFREKFFTKITSKANDKYT